MHQYSPEDPAEPPVGHVQVDHVLWMGCGLERGDVAALRLPTSTASLVRLDAGRPTYSDDARVTLADPASAERDIVLMPRLAIDILGVESGDYIVMEGSPGEDGRVPLGGSQVFEVPLGCGGQPPGRHRRIVGARFPASVETLGINQDLPMAFVDAGLRARLGVNGQTLGTVRVRPGRLHRFYVELREILLVLAAVALLGVVTVVNGPRCRSPLIVALVVMSTILVVGRMRRRLTPLQAAAVANPPRLLLVGVGTSVGNRWRPLSARCSR